MSKLYVLDSSAFLAMVNGEPGGEKVEKVLPQAVIGAANLAEVLAKLRDKGLAENEADELLSFFNLDIRPLTAAQAVYAGHLREATRRFGLSLGDRACLALAHELGAVAMTADREWAKIDRVMRGQMSIELLR